ncbi:hypothetical protein dsat_2681 [Alkalidesulfovibrio alkalitolerans DSM 16529]|jgi:uncharacterized protein HemX|uniref:DUF2802 domain-containing protein n=1 Tax=Alkalidesulfovibrio alkalitolerans DSM 16529 TaxID=1121439 RepID=S7UL99_9BACT|nr:hypothetical protein [Alkalidesulfovibrio alkalitolerans]EPR34639.1 hypothetical protein dsat_2681 [Alkalidesulfovibrio alkalitolerans DSM 16529]
MSMELLLVLLTVFEVLLLGLVIVFFLRLRKSEEVLSKLRDKQEELLNKLRFNTQMERELVASFEERQAELAALDQALAARAKELSKLLKQAQEMSRSPEFLREIVLTGHKRGKSAQELARSTGMSVDEVEFIIEQAAS